MSLLTRFAFRNLLRNWRRTLFTVCTLAIGVTLSIWTDNITKGRADDIVESVTSAYVGHLQISTPEFRKDELIQDYMNQDIVAEFPEASPRIHFAGLLSSGENSLPIVLDGVMPDRENHVTSLKNKVTQGDYLSSQESACTEKEILISREQADKLNVGLGDKVVIVGPASDGTLGNDLFRVRGIYQTESKAFDRRMSFSSYACVSEIGQVFGPHEMVFGLSKGQSEDKLEAAIRGSLAGRDLQLTSWRESVPQLYSIVRFSRAIHNAINFILFLVISAGIINVMMMTVFERTREFGVMSALGTSSKQVLSVVVLETIGLAIMGLALGTVLGALVVTYHHHFGFDLRIFVGEQYSAGQFSLSLMVYPELSFGSIARSTVITIGFMLLAGLFPALRASKLTPIEAMRTH